MKPKLGSFPSAVFLSWSLAAQGGFAASQPGGESLGTSDNESQRLEQIVVTARKRAESVQSVPISMAAFSGRDLEERGVSIMGDVARFTPGIVIDQGASASGGNHSTSIYIRGLGQSDPSAFADPAVA